MYGHPAIAALSARRPACVAVAACVAELSTTVPTEILLIPAGEFRARDGRPANLSAWRLDAAAAAALIAAAEQARGDFVIDYEHQTLNSQDNGRPAPAAGWFKRLEWREGQGLYAVDVRWTDAAKAHIAAGEYRYISPVFEYDRKTGAILSVLMAALTNYPALDGHSDLAARAAARFHLSTQSSAEEEPPVDRKQLIALLGLDDSASDEQLEQALAALKAKAATAEQKDAEIAALKGAAPDPARFVPVETVTALRNDVAALTAKLNAKEVDDLIEVALSEGKLLPAMESWARELGAKDVAALKSYLDKTPAIAALKGTQTQGKGPAGDGNEGELDAAALAVCRQLGIDPAEYKKTLAAAS